MKVFRPLFILWFIFCAVGFSVSLLYSVTLEPCIYASALSLFFLIIVLVIECCKEKKYPKEDYVKTISELEEKIQTMLTSFDEERQDALDYYVAWVHQIKTPIQVMKLKLADDTPENRALLSELFRIEQYVDMVLQYIRLGSDTNDLVIAEYSLDTLIKDIIHKYATQFVEKKLQFFYEPTQKKIITDAKWFSCILEQLISNAVKYTREGGVTISVLSDAIVIEDTGIGIAKEDLPRIFEKGYTGNNGRIGEKSSGLGLYLAKKAADLISVRLEVKSKPGQGSIFTIKSGKICP